ncbi:MAG: hypothetical protein AAF593_14885 [Planctomycetota bacterium]
MSFFELIFRWLITRLLPQADDGHPVVAAASALGLSRRPAPVRCSAVSRHARWAKFNRPPNRRPARP